MGDEMNRGAWSWQLVALLSRALDADERAVVIGDLEESRATASQAFAQVAGLVVRRQSERWLEPRPWLVLIALTLPLGLLLSFVSASWVESRAITAWYYAAHWSERARRPTIAQEIRLVSTSIVLAYAALVGWAWTIGWTIRSLSPRTAWVHVTLLGLIMFVGEAGVVPVDGRYGFGAASVFGVLLFKALLVAVAVWHGLRTSDKPVPIPRAAVVMLLVLTLGTWDWARFLYNAVAFEAWGRVSPWPNLGFDGRLGGHDDPGVWAMRLIPVALMWPALYVSGRAFLQAHQRGGSS